MVFENISKFDYEKYANIEILEGKKVLCRNAVMAFDIETSRLDDMELSFMYEWSLAISYDGESVHSYYGRYWNEFIDFINKINAINKNVIKQPIYVHNLPYEFSFLKGYLHFNTKDVMNIKSRSPIKAAYKSIEFRCSYRHSNMSLDEFCKKMGSKHRKLVGGLNYNIVRYPWTHLSKQEWKYCVYDTVALVEAILNEMKRDGDNLLTIPLTSTGYLRREAKTNIYEHDIRWIRAIQPDFEQYKMLKDAFMGGYTHANRYFVGEILENIHSKDRSSSYPHVQVFRRFPISKFIRVGAITEKDIYKKKDKKAILMKVQLNNLKLKDEYFGMPYLSISKVRGAIGAKIDNGKILACEMLETTITDVDYWIIKDIYDFDMIVIDAYEARYGYLPDSLVSLMVKYYCGKTDLKGVDDYLYHKSKNKLNSGYGMTAQDIAKISVLYKEEDRTFEPEQVSLEEKYVDAYNHAWLPYQWGVWTTALARKELFIGIMAVYKQGLQDGFTDIIYCDTDSIKYIGTVDMDAYNARCIEEGELSGKYAVQKNSGKKYYMGVYEQEGDYARFCTMGAKKYCYVDAKQKELHVTISGVNKKLGAKELGRIENFKPGFVFTKSAGMELKYNDNIKLELEIDNQHTLEICDNVYMRNSEYTLGYEKNYAKLLLALKNHVDNGYENMLVYNCK